MRYSIAKKKASLRRTFKLVNDTLIRRDGKVVEEGIFDNRKTVFYQIEGQPTFMEKAKIVYFLAYEAMPQSVVFLNGDATDCRIKNLLARKTELKFNTALNAEQFLCPVCNKITQLHTEKELAMCELHNGEK